MTAESEVENHSEADVRPHAANLLTLGTRCFFKNAIVYRLPESFSLSAAEFEEKLYARRLTDCGALEKERTGWVNSSPLGRTVHALEGHFLIALGTHKKLLPASAIKEEFNKRLARMEQEQGITLGRKQKKELKETVKEQLLAKAMVRTSATRAWIDTEERWVVVEASGSARAEAVIHELIETLGSFEATRVEADPDASVTMGKWVMDFSAPDEFTLDMDLELKSDSKAVIRYTNHPLDGQDIKTHLLEGKTVNRLGLIWNDRVSFMLTAALELKKLKYLEFSDEEAESGEEKDKPSPEELFEADFSLMASELSQLLGALVKALTPEEEEGKAS